MSIKVALIGRPNVGKSTLFNRLIGKKLALVHDEPGVTRDRRYGDAKLADLYFTLIDTAGLADPNSNKYTKDMIRQTELAIEEADVLLFMVDARIPCTPYDRELARQLAKHRKPIAVLSNKAEADEIFPGTLDAASFGFGEVIEISAEHGIGMDDLYDFLKSYVPEEAKEEAPANERPLRLAIMGRPNAGKSTLINQLLQSDRLLTGPEAGITRDSITIDWEWEGRQVRLVDTAGLRRKAKVQERLERMSTAETIRSLKYADIVALVMDAHEAMEKQDLQIADLALREGRGLVLVISKWDTVQDTDSAARHIRDMANRLMPNAGGAPVVFLSGLTGRNTEKLMPAVVKVYKDWTARAKTGDLNRWLRHTVEHHPPPSVQGKRIKPRYMAQMKARPPTFVLIASRGDQMPEGYKRYLINGIREAFDMHGVPIRLFVRQGKNPYAGKVGPDGPPRYKRRNE